MFQNALYHHMNDLHKNLHNFIYNSFKISFHPDCMIHYLTFFSVNYIMQVSFKIYIEFILYFLYNILNYTQFISNI